MSTLSRFLRTQLDLRGESPEQFAKRTGIAFGGLYKIIRGETEAPRRDTLQRIAAGLNMDLTEMEQAMDPHVPDPVEQQILSLVPLMREAVKGIPRSMWATVISKTFTQAVEQTNQIADALATIASEHGGPLSTASELPISEQIGSLNEDGDEPNQNLVDGKVPWHPHVTARSASQRELVHP